MRRRTRESGLLRTNTVRSIGAVLSLVCYLSAWLIFFDDDGDGSSGVWTLLASSMLVMILGYFVTPHFIAFNSKSMRRR